MDLGETIRRQVQEAVKAALRSMPGGDGGDGGGGGDGDVPSTGRPSTGRPSTGRTVASATNVSSSGHSVSVYVDDEVTIVERDGKRRVIRHDEDEEPDEAPPGGC